MKTSDPGVDPNQIDDPAVADDVSMFESCPFSITYPKALFVIVLAAMPSVFDDVGSALAEARPISALVPSAPVTYTACPLVIVLPDEFFTYVRSVVAVTASATLSSD